MPDLTPAELTLLGLLVEQPRHGYELEAVIAARGMRNWTEIGFSSIYFLLDKLRTRDLIVELQQESPRRGKARRVFQATEEGTRVCAENAEAAIAELRPVFPPVLVGLANETVIPPARMHVALAARAAAVREKLGQLREASDGQRAAPAYVQAIFDYAIGQLVAEQQWLSDYQDGTST